MEFRLDDGQVDLQRTVARFCEDRFPLDTIAAREGLPVDRARWTEMAQLGIFGLRVPEAHGGSGLGAIEGAIVFEQLGAHLVPGPVLWTLLGAPHLDDVVGGGVVVGGITAAAVRDGSAIVEHAADLDILLLVGDDGIRALRTASLAPPTPLQPLDPLTPVGRFTDLPPGDLVADAAAAAALRALGTVLSAAMLTGIASQALEVARAYALEREQFGSAIGSFQAIKHLLADMYVRSTLAQSATYAAAAVLQAPGDDDPARATAGAKLLAGEAAITNASNAVQILGGMGFTWDMLPNHLLKRAWVLEQGFGTADDHALHLGTSLVAASR